MLRLGRGLPALMQLLGHKDIPMTLRYAQVTQLDLQREFHTGRQRAAQPRAAPVLSDIPQALSDENDGRRIQRLDRRLLDLASQLERITTTEK